MADQVCNHTNTDSTPYTNSEIEARLIAYLVLTILSTFANTLVIITFIVEKSLRTTFNIFILDLAIIDLLTSIFRMGFKVLIIVNVKGPSWPYGQATCNVVGVLQSFMYTANAYLLMAIAICRYIAIVLSKTHLITKKVVHIVMIIIWFVSIIVSLMPVFGWNRYCYRPFQFTCTLDSSLDSSLGASLPTFIMVTEFIIPMTVIIFCYVRIFINLKRNSNRMRTVSSLPGNNSHAMHQIAQREAKVTIGMFILFLAFVICFGPYSLCVFLLLDVSRISVNRDVIFFCGFMVNFNSLCNPIIYGIWQKPFRTAYCRILFYFCPKCVHHWYSSSDSTQEETDQKFVVSHLSPQDTALTTNTCSQRLERH